jgi:predicted transcriptional regulator
MLINADMDLNDLADLIGDSKGPIPSLDVSRMEQASMLRERLMMYYEGMDTSELLGARKAELYDPIPINGCSVCGLHPEFTSGAQGEYQVQCEKHEPAVTAPGMSFVTALESWNDIVPTFTMFKKVVSEARPDIVFTFTEGRETGSHEATWTFPGAIVGGSTMFIYGTTQLCWGLGRLDTETWEKYEISQGREPRWT